MLQARGVEGGGGVEEQPFDPQGMGQPGLELLLDPVVLAGGDRQGTVPHGRAEQAQETVVLTLPQQLLELVISERVGGRDRRRPGQPMGGDIEPGEPTGVLAPRPP